MPSWCIQGQLYYFTLIYAGKQTNVVYSAMLEVTVNVVSTLVEHLVMKEHSLFIDSNWVRPQLTSYHHTCKIMMCVTLKKSRKCLAVLGKTLVRWKV
jgi:hypothetical protein